MAKVTEYSRITKMKDNDILLVDGPDGTRTILQTDASKQMGGEVIMVNETAGDSTKVVINTTDEEIELATMADLEPVEEDVSGLKTHINNQIVPEIITLAGWHIVSSGAWALDSRYDCEYFKVQGGDVLVITPNANDTLYAMLKSVNPVNGGTPDYATGYSSCVAARAGQEITVPSDAKYIIYRVNANGTSQKPSSIVLNGYEMYEAMYQTVANAENRLCKLETTVGEPFTAVDPINYYNGGYEIGYIVTDGTVNPTSGYSCSTVQELKAGTYLFVFSSSFGSNATRCYRYNADNSLKDIVYGEDIGSSICRFTLTENSRCRFNIGNESTPATWMIVSGTATTDYPSSYSENFTPYIKADDNVKIESDNFLIGKKLCCEGDSIMYGAGYVGGFARIIAQRNGMTLQNNAVNGATIRTGTTWSGGANRHWISTSMASLPSDGDYYIFDGWVNDVNSQTTLGSVSWGYAGTLDTTTFCGAFEQCCKTLSTTFAGKKVGYVFVHRIWKPTDTLVQSFIDKMIEILEKWGVPYINLMELDPPINEIDALKTAYTKDGDGWHPNEEGYRKFYVDKVESWMKTL